MSLGRALARAQNETSVRVVYGVVQSDLTVSVAGDATSVDLPSLVPLVDGDYVAILVSGADMLVLGTVGGGAWAAWTPAITSTSLNLGTTGSATGRYARLGRTIVAQFQVTWGGTGVNGGSTGWELSYPETPDTGVASGFGGMVGQGRLRDATDGRYYDVHFAPNGSVYRTDSATEAVTGTNPITIGSSDVLLGTLLYEIA